MSGFSDDGDGEELHFVLSRLRAGASFGAEQMASAMLRSWMKRGVSSSEPSKRLGSSEEKEESAAIAAGSGLSNMEERYNGPERSERSEEPEKIDSSSEIELAGVRMTLAAKITTT